MAVSRRTCNCEPLARDEAAVTEVTGYLLILGILTALLSVSMLGFSAAKEGAEERGAEVRAESVAQRVASVILDAAVFAEAQGDALAGYDDELDLPDDIEGRSYTVELDADTDNVTVRIPDFGIEVSQPLFRSDAPPDIVICGVAPIPPGSLRVVVTADNPDDPPAGVECDTPLGDPPLYVLIQP